MNKYILVIIGIILVIITIILVFQYVFSIYEIDYIVEKKELKEGESVRILARPLNSLGFNAPFREIKIKYSIKQGKDLIDLKEIEGGILITAKSEGNVIINTHVNMAVLDSQIKIEINK